MPILNFNNSLFPRSNNNTANIAHSRVESKIMIMRPAADGYFTNEHNMNTKVNYKLWIDLTFSDGILHVAW